VDTGTDPPIGTCCVATVGVATGKMHPENAAALAAMLVPLGSVAVEGLSINCGFSGASNGSFSGCGSASGGAVIFDFDQTSSAEDDYKVILDFVGGGAFDMTVTDHHLSHLAFLAREGLPGTYDCVDFVDPTVFDSSCREFEFDPPDGSWSSFTFEFVWTYDSETNGYPNGTDPPGVQPGQVRILQNKGEPQEGSYTIDMCLAAITDGNYTPCSYLASSSGDPRIGGGNEDFSGAVSRQIYAGGNRRLLASHP
jgi:hypothetical protein